MGAKTRLAIECDGDAWHGPEAYEQDLARQRDLERSGWQFFRLRESTFYVDQPAALEELWETLRELEIHPSGWTSERPTDLDGDIGDVLDDEPVAISAVEAESFDRDLRENSLIADAQPSETQPKASELVAARTSARPELNTDADASSAGLEVPHGELQPYREFSGFVTPAQAATRPQLIEGLVAVVAAEGPIVGHRLHAAYVKGSGGQRVGKNIAKALNSAITSAVRQGTLVDDNPLGEPGVKPRTFRLPQQPEVIVRDLGPRALEHIPPRELAALLEWAGETCGSDNNELLFRSTLDRLGLKRLTSNVQARLEAVLHWLQEQHVAE